MALDLYYQPGSAPCRTVRLVAAALGVELNLIHVDLLKQEHLNPDFIKINPQHTIPTLVDDGFVLWESRAIITYLANKLVENNTLYPKDPRARALVDQRLCFDLGTLYQRYAEYHYPIAFNGLPADDVKLEKVHDVLSLLDTFLEGQTWTAGPNLTIADLAIIVTVSTMELAGVDLTRHPNVFRWYQTVQEAAPEYDKINRKGIQAFKGVIEEISKGFK